MIFIDQTSNQSFATIARMKAISQAGVRSVERFGDGISVEFSDGRSAIYTSFLLNAVYDLALLMNEADMLEEAAAS